MKLTKKQIAAGMDCIIVGGCANGTVLQKIRADANWIELTRPDFIKPLEHSYQTVPEVINESDTYEVHPIALVNSEPRGAAVFGIAVVEGESLTWAFTELAKGYCENVTTKLIAAGIVERH